MPAVTFFLMLGALRELDAYEKIQACDIQAIANTDFRYHNKIRSRYVNIVDAKNVDIPEQRGSIQKPALDAASVEAKHFMLNTFAQMKRAYG